MSSNSNTTAVSLAPTLAPTRKPSATSKATSRSTSWLTTLGLCLSIGLIAATASSASDDEGEAALSPELLAPTQVEPISTDQFRQLLEHHRGKVVMVNLWATWCIPCIQELPDISLLQKRFRDDGLVVLAVSLDKPSKLEESVRPFFAKTAPDLVSYLATDDEFEFVSVLDPDWLGALPTSFFLDRDGEVQANHTGRLLFKQLETEVLELLGD